MPHRIQHLVCGLRAGGSLCVCAELAYLMLQIHGAVAGLLVVIEYLVSVALGTCLLYTSRNTWDYLGIPVSPHFIQLQQNQQSLFTLEEENL